MADDATDSQWEIFNRAMDMLGDVPGETLLERISRLQGWYLEMQIMVGQLKHELEVTKAVHRLCCLQVPSAAVGTPSQPSKDTP